MTKDTTVATKKDNLAEEFLRYLAVERNASPRTLKAYRQALGAFRGQNQKPWKQCTPDDCRNYLFAIMKRGQARSYVRLQFSALRAFYKFLADRKRLRIDPVRQLQLPKVAKSAFARLAYPRWRQSKNIALRRTCTRVRSSLTNHGNEFRRDRSG